MPKREDEYWAGKKEPKGQGLCPFCGSSKLYYNKRYESWRCGKCEESFPSPSYGPGRDLEEEARLRRITAIPQSKFVGGTGKNRTIRWKTPKGGGFPMKKTFLVLLVIACLAAAAWTGYLLFTNQTDPVIGGVILAVDIGVLLWNISVLRRYRVGVGTVISIFLLVALIGATVSAFAGIAPCSEIKDKVVDYFGGSDIEARIAPEWVSISDRYCSVQVKLTPSDSVKLDSIYNIQLISSEGYSFGRSLVYWTSYDSRTIKTATFMIPVSDKVATKIRNLEEEALAKLFYGEDLANTKKWYEANLNKILKVKIISNIELVTDAVIYTETLATGDYQVFAKLTPSSFVKAGEIYSVQLRWEVENDPYGEYRYVSKSVAWNQAEIDAKAVKVVSFGNRAKDFWDSYTFSIRVLPGG